MRGIGSIVCGILILAMAIGGLVYGVPLEFILPVMGLAGLLLAGGIFALVTGQSVELTSAVEFVQNPAAAMFDGAIDAAIGRDDERQRDAKSPQSPLTRLSQMMADTGAQESGGQPFDADAALARYMANREAVSPADVPQVQAAPGRSFGRKGL